MPKPKEKENAYLSYAPKVTNYIGLRLASQSTSKINYYSIPELLLTRTTFQTPTERKEKRKRKKRLKIKLN